MRPLDEVFPALTTSAFRRRFRLAPRELEYLRIRGLDAVLAHATQFVDARLAAAQPANDGRQTPFRGHPAFVAQHATATCCRGCLQQWHAIPRGRPLTEPEKRHVVTAIGRWLDAALRQAQAREVGTDAAALDGASEPARRRAPSRLAPRKENSMAQPDKNRTGIPSDLQRNRNRDRKLDRRERDNPAAVEGLDEGSASEAGDEAASQRDRAQRDNSEASR